MKHTDSWSVLTNHSHRGSTVRWHHTHNQVKSSTQAEKALLGDAHWNVKQTDRWCIQTGQAHSQVKWGIQAEEATVRWRTMEHTENAHMQVMHTDGWSTQTGEAWNINTGTAHRQVKLTTQASESLPGWTVSGSAFSLGCRRRPQSRRRTERRRWSGGMLQMGAGNPEIKGQTLSA